MSERDELDVLHRRLLVSAKQQPEYANNEVSAISGYSEGAEHALDIVRLEGYRKPRTITTAEELDALPFESVIRDGDECVLERWGDLEESGWVTVMVTSFVPRDQVTLPATVLYEGTRP